MAQGIATALSAIGDHVTLLSNQTLAPKLTRSTFYTQPVRSDMGPLLGTYLDGLLVKAHPDTIVLCDYPSNATVLQQNGVAPTTLLRKDVRTCALDIWDAELTGSAPDVFGRRQADAAASAWIDVMDRTETLHPVPILWPRTSGQGGAAQRHFCNLPPTDRPTSAERAETAASLGIGRGEKMVLFCTAKWQHLEFASEAGRGMAASIPRLVADYIYRSGDDVHLVHVGPQSYAAVEHQLGARYHRLPPLSTMEFDRVLAASDVLLSANIAASTVARAMLLDVPPLILQNAVQASTVEDAEVAAGAQLSDRLRRWLADALPLYPFALWPIGFHNFLSPVLSGNPYVDALTIVDILDERGVEMALSRLLRDTAWRGRQLHRQTLYLNRIRSLPSVGELLAATTAR
jgi:hypothetical protein